MFSFKTGKKARVSLLNSVQPCPGAPDVCNQAKRNKHKV